METNSEIKGHTTHNNCWILTLITLYLYFMIIYMWRKYECIIPMFSKDIARKPFFSYVPGIIWYIRARVVLYVPVPIENGKCILNISEDKLDFRDIEKTFNMEITGFFLLNMSVKCSGINCILQPEGKHA